MITHVEVADAWASDERRHDAGARSAGPARHLARRLVADTAYGSGDNAVAAERMGTEVVSPVKGPPVQVEEEPETVTRTDFEVKADEVLLTPIVYPHPRS